MDSPAKPTDLSSRSLRTLNTRELEVGGTLLGDAWAIIVAAVPEVESRIDTTPAGVAYKDLIIQVQCAMVLRVLNNPQGKLEEHGDDYGYRLDQAVSTGALYLSDAELARLSDGGAVSDGAFTIRPAGVGRGRGHWSAPDTWTPLP